MYIKIKKKLFTKLSVMRVPPTNQKIKTLLKTVLLLANHVSI